MSAEQADVACHALDLEAGGSSDEPSIVARELCQPHPSARAALRGRTWLVPRLRRAAPATAAASLPAQPHRLVLSAPGSAEDVRWEPAPIPDPGPGAVRLRVEAAGINFRDVLRALNLYVAPGDAPLGAECVGIVEAIGTGVDALRVGETVFGFAPGSLASHVTVPAGFVIAVPPHIRPDLLAGVPAAFLTAMYGLQHVAAIGNGAVVLVHAGAGGVGLAALQVARALGARVIATAGSPAKRDYLRNLGVEDVFDSRSTGFADAVLAATDGHGVDAVLNSLAGDFIPAGLRTVRPGGWFLELGKRAVWTAAQVAALRADIHYRVFDLGEEAAADATLLPALLLQLRARLLDGTYTPLPVRVVPASRITEAFRAMAHASHIGKLVVHLSESVSRPDTVRPHGTYLITGGTGALGVRTARWLVQRGARTIVLTGRHAPGAETQAVAAECRAMGARVEIRIADSADAAAMASLVDEIRTGLPPLRGVVHAAGVLDDRLLVNQTWEGWQNVVRGKAEGAHVLDALTRGVDLDFFVLYSAAGWILGPIGQGAYAAANAELDGLAWARHTVGLPALSIAWGQWKDAGMAARTATAGPSRWTSRGLGWLEPKDALDTLERLLGGTAATAMLQPIDWRQYMATVPGGMDPEFFRAFAPSRTAQHPSAPARSTAPQASSPIEQWRTSPASDRRTLVLTHVAAQARHVLGVPPSTALDPAIALKDQGLDSLMAVELRNALTRSLATMLPATLLFDYPTLDALVAHLMTALDLSAAPVAAPDATSSPDGDIAAMSDAEAEALLLAELDAPPQETRR